MCLIKKSTWRKLANRVLTINCALYYCATNYLMWTQKRSHVTWFSNFFKNKRKNIYPTDKSFSGKVKWQSPGLRSNEKTHDGRLFDVTSWWHSLPTVNSVDVPQFHLVRVTLLRHSTQPRSFGVTASRDPRLKVEPPG